MSVCSSSLNRFLHPRKEIIFLSQTNDGRDRYAVPNVTSTSKFIDGEKGEKLKQNLYAFSRECWSARLLSEIAELKDIYIAA